MKNTFVPHWRAATRIGDVDLDLAYEQWTPHSSQSVVPILDIARQSYNIMARHNHDDSRARFKLFAELPLEIRLKIWRWSLPRTRLVEILFDESIGACRSNCAVPTALSVCTESRTEALRFYKLRFATPTAESTIYFDSEWDEFYLGIGNFSPLPQSVLTLWVLLNQDDIEAIQHMSVDSELAVHSHNGVRIDLVTAMCGSTPSTTTRRCTNLRSLTSIFNRHEDNLNHSPTSSFGDKDIILSAAADSFGEYQAWEIELEQNDTLRILSWELPLQSRLGPEERPWQKTISDTWRNLERYLTRRDRPYTSEVVRFVGWNRFSSQTNTLYSARARFLEQRSYLYWTGCLYKGPLLKDLIRLRGDTTLYNRLTVDMHTTG